MKFERFFSRKPEKENLPFEAKKETKLRKAKTPQEDKPKYLRRDFLKIFGVGAAAAGVLSACGPAEWILPEEKQQEVKESLEKLLARNCEAHDHGQIKTFEYLLVMAQKVKEQIPDFEKFLDNYKKNLLQQLQRNELKDFIKIFIKSTAKNTKFIANLGISLGTLDEDVHKIYQQFYQVFSQQAENIINAIFCYNGALFDQKILQKFMDNLVKSDFSEHFLLKIVNAVKLPGIIDALIKSLVNSTDDKGCDLPLPNYMLLLVNDLLVNHLNPSLLDNPMRQGFASLQAAESMLMIDKNNSLNLFIKKEGQVLLEMPYHCLYSLGKCILREPTLKINEKLALLQGENLDNLKNIFALDKARYPERKTDYCQEVYDKIFQKNSLTEIVGNLKLDLARTESEILLFRLGDVINRLFFTSNETNFPLSNEIK